MSVQIRVVGLLTGLALVAGASAQDTKPVLTEDLAARLIQKSPAFTGDKAATRKFSRVVRMHYIAEQQGQDGWLVETQWQEGGKTRSAVAPITRVPTGKEKDPWFFQQEGWGVAIFAEDKTLDEFIAIFKRGKVSANEAAAIGDIRTVISAEAAYAYANGEAYDELRCLAEPAKCVTGYTGPYFIDTRLTVPEKTGYRRKFYAGPKAPKAKSKSATGVLSFAYTAVPITIGETGTRGFCADDSGIICFTTDGSEPKVAAGKCAQPCQVLQ
jgi:type IV pilus assembly protein PilA